MSIHLDHYARKRVVVTGGAGAIGRNLTATLAALGAESVIVLDDLSSAEPWNLPEERNVLFVEGSVTDDAALKRVFSEKPHIVFHLAAFFANQRSVDYPERDLEVNGMGTLRLLQMASLCGIDRFVYASSGCSVYGDAAPLPLVEEFMSLHLTSPYQITKVLGEYYANFYRHHHELPIAIARLFNSYGPGEIPGQYRNVIPNFVYWAMQGRPLPLTGNPHATRDFTFVGDIVDGLLRIGFDQNAIGEAMNIASGRETRISDLADMVNELTGNEAGVVKAAPRRWDTKDRLLASTELARDLVGYQPQTDFASGLRQTYDWFTTNWNDIAHAADFPPGMSSAVRELEA